MPAWRRALVVVAASVLGVLGVIGALSLVGDDAGDDRDRSDRPERAERPRADDDEPTPTTVAPLVNGLPLGTLRTASQPGRCPAGTECVGFEVTCPGLAETARGVLSRSVPTGSSKGVVMFFTGGPGKTFYSDDNPATDGVLARLRERGLEVVQVRWSFGWLRAAPGEQAGPAALACRPATVIGWVQDTYAPETEDEASPGVCGFCLTGNSGGASQITYALSHYGLAPRVDVVVASSGPPHAQLARGCLLPPGEEPYWFADSNRQVIDSSYGAGREGGPCVGGDAAFAARFDADSVDLGGEDYRYPTTRVHFIVSPNDSVVAVRARDLAEKLRLSGSPWVTLQEIPDMTHNIQQSADGLAALEAALLGRP